MRAATRLERMAATLSKEPGAGQDTLPPPSADLCELIGRSFKGLAVQRLDDKAPAKKKGGPHRSAKQLLDLARAWYGRGASLLDKGHTGRQCAFNQLAIAVITGSAEGTDANLEALATASQASLASVRPDDRVAESFMAADVAVLRTLLAGKLGDGKTFKQLVARYRECRTTLGLTDRPMPSVLVRFTLLADLLDVEGCPRTVRKQAVPLRELSQALQSMRSPYEKSRETR
jgi:hypothetical protein